MSRNSRSNSRGNSSTFDNKAAQPSNSVNRQVEKDLYSDGNWTKMLNSRKYNRKIKKLVELHKRSTGTVGKISRAERVAIHYFSNTLPGLGERRARSGNYSEVGTVDVEKFDNSESFQKFRKVAPKTDEKVAA